MTQHATPSDTTPIPGPKSTAYEAIRAKLDEIHAACKAAKINWFAAFALDDTETELAVCMTAINTNDEDDTTGARLVSDCHDAATQTTTRDFLAALLGKPSAKDLN